MADGQRSWRGLIGAFVVGVVLLAILAIGGQAAIDGVTGQSDLTEACQDEFGDGWDARGWMKSNPPAIQCQHKNGSDAMMDMPEELAQDRGIVSANWDSTGENDV